MSGGRHGMEPSSDRASAPCRRGARRRTAAAPKTRAASAPVLVLLLAATCCPFASADLASKDPRKAPRQLLIKLRTGQLLVAPADTAAERAVATGAGPQLDAQLSLRGLSPARVNAADASVESTLEALNARDDVEFAQEDHPVVPQLTPNDALWGQQWGMRAVGAEAAWDLSVGGLAVPAGAAAAAAVRGAAASLEAAPAPAPATARSLAAAHAPAPALAPAHAPAPAPAHPPPSPTPTLTPAPTALPTQTPLEKASLPINATGSAGLVTVCVVDSGIDSSHPQLAGSMHPLPGLNMVANDTSGDGDGLGHGTHIAGVIAAAGNDGGQVAGLAWGAAAGSLVRLLPCKFISEQGFGYTSGAVACIDFCLASGADVISASWSAGSEPNPALEEAVRRTASAGVLFVAAAGNQGFDLREVPTWPAAYSLAHRNVLTVGASALRGEWSDYSSWGPGAVHLSAPGASVLSTWPGGFTEYSSGTSMAAPFVSGAAALLMAATGRRVTPLKARRLLLATAEPLESHRGRCSSGGRLRVDRALRRALGLPQQPPSPPPSPPRPPPPPPPCPRLLPPPPVASSLQQRSAPKRPPPPPPPRKQRKPPPPPPKWRRPRPPPPRRKSNTGRNTSRG